MALGIKTTPVPTPVLPVAAPAVPKQAIPAVKPVAPRGIVPLGSKPSKTPTGATPKPATAADPAADANWLQQNSRPAPPAPPARTGSPALDAGNDADWLAAAARPAGVAADFDTGALNTNPQTIQRNEAVTRTGIGEQTDGVLPGTLNARDSQAVTARELAAAVAAEPDLRQTLATVQTRLDDLQALAANPAAVIARAGQLGATELPLDFGTGAPPTQAQIDGWVQSQAQAWLQREMADTRAQLDAANAALVANLDARPDLLRRVVGGDTRQTAGAAAFNAGITALASTATETLRGVGIAADAVQYLLNGDTTDNALVQSMQDAKDYMNRVLPVDRNGFFVDLAGGAGGFAGFMVGGLTARALTGGSRLLQNLTIGVLGGAQQGAQSADLAMEGTIGREIDRLQAGNANGVNDEQIAALQDALAITRYKAFVGGFGVGATELIPLDRIIARANAATGGAFFQRLRNAASGGVEEAAQEFGQNVLADAVQQQIADPEHPIDWESAGGAAVIAFLLGAGAGGVLVNVDGRQVTVDELARTHPPAGAPGTPPGPTPPVTPEGVPEGAAPADTLYPAPPASVAPGAKPTPPAGGIGAGVPPVAGVSPAAGQPVGPAVPPAAAAPTAVPPVANPAVPVAGGQPAGAGVVPAGSNVASPPVAGGGAAVPVAVVGDRGVLPPPVAQPQGIPFVVTQHQRAQLSALGVPLEQIRNMTPAQVVEAIRAGRRIGPAAPPTDDAAWLASVSKPVTPEAPNVASAIPNNEPSLPAAGVAPAGSAPDAGTLSGGGELPVGTAQPGAGGPLPSGGADAGVRPEVSVGQPVAKLPKRGRSLDLLQFIASIGGIKPDSDLDAMDAGKHFLPGHGKFVRANGRDPDKVRELVAESGYFGTGDRTRSVGETTVDDLKQMIGRALGGERITPDDADDMEHEAAAKLAAERERYRDSIEFELRGWANAYELGDDPKWLRAMVDLVEEAGLDHTFTAEEFEALNERASMLLADRKIRKVADAEIPFFEAEEAVPVPAGERPGDAPPSSGEDFGGWRPDDREEAPPPGDWQGEAPERVEAAAEDPDEVARPGKRRFKLSVDNPGGGWLARKQAAAEEDIRGGGLGMGGRGLRGAVTASASVTLDAAKINIPGANAESPGPGNPKYDALIEQVRRDGKVNDPGIIGINHKGEAFIMEGNNRVAVAKLLGLPVPMEIQWRNGGEEAAGEWSPKNIEAKLASAVDQTDAGAQLVIPGAEKINDAEHAQLLADKPLQAKTPQKAADDGLFGDSAAQTDLVDLAKQPTKEKIPTVDLIAESQALGSNAAGEPLYENGSRGRFRVRHDRKDREPEGYPDFGGDLVPTAKAEAADEQPKKPYVPIRAEETVASPFTQGARGGPFLAIDLARNEAGRWMFGVQHMTGGGPIRPETTFETKEEAIRAALPQLRKSFDANGKEAGTKRIALNRWLMALEAQHGAPAAQAEAAPAAGVKMTADVEGVTFHETPPPRSGASYYIATGEKGAMYTLRRFVGASVVDGKDVPARDTFMVNLSREKQEAIRKAKQHVKLKSIKAVYWGAPDTLNDIEVGAGGSGSSGSAVDMPTELVDPITAAGLKVKPLTAKSGKVYWAATGDLKKNEAILDQLGFAPLRKINNVWQRSYFTSDPTAALAEALTTGKVVLKEPSAPLPMAGTQASEAVTSIDPDVAKALLAKAKIVVTADKGGFVVTGKTFDIKGQIKEAGGRWDGAMKGWRFSNDPTQKLAAAVSANAGTNAGTDGEGNTGVGIDPAEDARLRAAREREDARADERVADAARLVSDESKGLIRAGLKFGIPAKVVNEQIEDVGMIVNARERKKPMFLLANEAGTGKAQPLTAKILTPSGWKLMGDVVVGDDIIAGDGTTAKVTAVYPQGEKEIFRVGFSDGSSTECCDEHLWLTQTRESRAYRSRNDKWPVSQPQVRHLFEIRQTLRGRGNTLNHSIPVVGAVAFDERLTPLHPYVMGALLGDGCLMRAPGTVSLSSADQDLLDRVSALLPPGTELRQTGGYDWAIRCTARTYRNPMNEAIRLLGLEGVRGEDKRVPEDFLFNTVGNRIDLLRGLMDTDGWVESGGTSSCFSSSSKGLAEDVVFLVRSLGGTATISVATKHYSYKGERRTGKPAYVVRACLPARINPFWLSRKADAVVPKSKYQPRRFVTSVETVGVHAAQCIAIDHPSRLYVTDDFIVTHNTFVMGAAIRELRNRGQKRFIYVTQSQDLIAQIERDLAPYGLEGVEFATYSKMPDEAKGAVIFFDETHNIKNLAGSQRGKNGADLISQADFTVFASATPFQNPVEAKYLEATGIYGKHEDAHSEWAKMYGAAVRRRKFYNPTTRREQVEEIVYWPGRGKKKDGAAARQWFFKQGVMTQRAMQIDPGMVDVAFTRAPVAEQYVKLYKQIEDAYETVLRRWTDEDGNSRDYKITSEVARHRETTIKRVLEAAKGPAAIARAKEIIAEGKNVVLFVETKAERTIGKFRKSEHFKEDTLYSFPEMQKLMEAWAREAEAAHRMHERAPPQPFASFIYEIARGMHDHGITHDLPSVADDFMEAMGGKEKVAVYTGAVAQAAARKNKEEFLSGKKKVLVATMAKGGTGLSLHDTVGNRETVQLNINLPWAAWQVDQVSARVARYGLKSKARIEWLFASNIDWETTKLAPRVGARMADMGAIVKGLEVKAAEKLLGDFDFEGEIDVKQAAGGEIALDAADGYTAEDDIYANAARLEKGRVKASDTSGGFFETPYPLAALMTRVAGIRPGDKVLEPSAGTGNLLEFVPTDAKVTAIEVRRDNLDKLNERLRRRGITDRRTLGTDFIEWSEHPGMTPDAKDFDVVLMNPPFEREAGTGALDVAHVERAYGLLKPGGRLVAIMGEGAFFRQTKQESAFREWLDDVGATVIKLPENAFKKSGTGVRARMVVIDKDRPGGRSTIDLADMESASLRGIEMTIPPRQSGMGMMEEWDRLGLGGMTERDRKDKATTDLFAAPAAKAKPHWPTIKLQPLDKYGRAVLGPFDPKGLPLGEAAQTYLVEQGKATGVEFILAFDRDGKTILHQHGSASATGDLKDLIPHFDKSDAAVVTHHNHPKNYAPSLMDLLFLAFEGHAEMWVHAHNGTSWRLALTNEVRTEWAKDFRPASIARASKPALMIAAATNLTTDPLADLLRPSYVAGKITRDDCNIAGQFYTMEALRRAGLINVETNAFVAQDILDQIGPGLEAAIDKAAERVRNKVFGNGAGTAAARRDGGRPWDVWHPGTVGAALGRDRGGPVGRDIQGVAGNEREAANRPAQGGGGFGQGLNQAAEEKKAVASQRAAPVVRAERRAETATIANNIQAIVTRLLGRKIRVEFSDTINDTTTSEWDRQQRAIAAGGDPLAVTAGGQYSHNQAAPARSFLRLALADPLYDPTDSAYHEAWHHIEIALSTQEERELLTRDLLSANSGLKRLAEEHLRSNGFTDDVNALPAYEITAIAFEGYARRKAAAQAIGPVHIGIRQFFNSIMELLERIKVMLGRRGITTWEDVFEAAYRGDFANRTPTSAWAEVTGAAEAIAEYGQMSREGREMFGMQEGTNPFDPGAAQNRQKVMLRQFSLKQPIDRILRFPLTFDIFGGMNAKGEWKPGLFLSDKAGKLLTSSKFSETGRFRFLNPMLHKVRAGLIDRYGLDPNYVERDRTRALDERGTLAQAADILDTLKKSNVGPAEAKVLQAILTGEAVTDAQMEALAAPIRDAIDSLGQEAVDLGLLSAESFERNRGAYLHRVYMKHESEQNGLIRFVNRVRTGNRRRIIGSQFKGRGLWQEIPVATLIADRAAPAPVKGQRFRMLDLIDTEGQGQIPDMVEGKKPRVVGRVYVPGDAPAPARYAEYQDRGVWEVRGFRNGNPILWRDYTKTEREQMGEITDARYTITKTFMQMAHDLATGRFYRDIAMNRSWAQPEEPAPGTWKDASEYSRFWEDETIEWVRVPETKISKSNTLRYAALAGKFVRSEIWRDINELELLQRSTFWNTILTEWKKNKALALDTPLPTPGGWTTMGAIKVGDRLFDDKGDVCTVLEVRPVQHDRPCFSVQFSDGTSIVADDEHIWFVVGRNNKKGKLLTTKEIRETLTEPTRGDRNHGVPVVSKALETPGASLPIPPYTLGLWLGDGDSSRPRITAGAAVLDELEGFLAEDGVFFGTRGRDKRSSAVTLTINLHQPVERNRKPNAFKSALAGLEILGSKRIPSIYLRASAEQRRALLQGLMDSDGWASEAGQCGYATSDGRLRDDVLELLRSLGYKPKASSHTPSSGKEAWRIMFVGYSDEPPCRLACKAGRLLDRPGTRVRSQTRQIVAVTPVPSVPVRCIAVSSPSHLYLAGEGMIPTHNTARSPVTHMNNVMSNFLFMDMNDVGMADLLGALRGLIARDGAYKEALDNGAFGADMVAQEMRDDILKPILKEIEAQTQGGTGTLSSKMGALGKIFEKMWAGAKATDAAALRLYQLEDEVFRLALYNRRRRQGYPPREAALDARDTFLNYDIRAPWVNAARRSFLPFISYTYRAVPGIAKALTTHPWKLAKYAAIAYGMDALAYALLGLDDDDEDRERRSLRDEEQGYTWVGAPRMLRMPWDSNGNPVFLDIRRFIPAGDVFDLQQSNSAIALPSWLQLGGPLAIAMEIVFNKSLFTGDPLVNTLTDDIWERTQTIGDYLWKSVMPGGPWIPGSWYWEKIVDSVTGARDWSGRPYDLASAIASAFGIKLKPQDVENGFALHAFAYEEVERALRAEANRIGRDMARNQISQAEGERQMAGVIADMENLNRRRLETFAQ
jgi:SAM-dependent methyltransferase